MPQTTLTIAGVAADLAATERDLKRCKTIAENIEAFIEDERENDRSEFRVDLMKWEALAKAAERLADKISETLNKMTDAEPHMR